MKKLWGGRFQKNTDALAEDFHSSISFDRRLYRHDIRGSIAHARMLGEEGIITRREAAQIIAGLEEILQEIEDGKIQFSQEAEDIHMHIEAVLTEKIGPAGKKLHTGRSRNDQVALDTRLFVREEIEKTRLLLLDLVDVLVGLAGEHAETIMPGFTHLQIAQPVTLGHHLLAYTEMFKRDYGRLEDCRRRADVMPLGSGALAGTTFPLNREKVARELGFSRVSENSMDSVSDRDYIIEFLAALSLVMMHLSRLAEEIILWASQGFAFVELDDAYSTGSSIMPQKKNPDVAELVRGKTGRVYGDLLALLAVMKGLPLAYNKDMQEDKEALFDGVDTVQKCLLVFAPMLATAVFRKEEMYKAAGKGFSNATDLADYLVRKGMSFRDAHRLAGSLVSYCVSCGKVLEELTLEEMKKAGRDTGMELADRIDSDVYEALRLENVVGRRLTHGGTAPVRVREAVERARRWLEEKRAE
ncbi:MAG: argininosuccinate lyase [Peptococcaceae bacterium]|nr:argininosuccinate lyase [Peptococcaceae bacterium]MDH7525873.1 argininosuccinate lyase [Peptococcaceae bacterium]